MGEIIRSAVFVAVTLGLAVIAALFVHFVIKPLDAWLSGWDRP